MSVLHPRLELARPVSLRHFAGVGLALLGLLVGTELAAQSSRTSGLVVGAHLEAASVVIGDADRSNGGGGGLLVGWAFNNGLGVFTQLDASNVDVRNQPGVEGSWTIAQLDLGLRYHFSNPEKTVVPYLQIAGSARDVTVTEIAIIGPDTNDQVDASGFGLTFGGGVMLHPTESVAFEFGLLFGWGELDEATVDGVNVPEFTALDIQSTRLNLGLVWWPLG